MSAHAPMAGRAKLVPWLAVGLALAAVATVAGLVLRTRDAPRVPSAPRSAAGPLAPVAVESAPAERAAASDGRAPRASAADDPAARAKAERRERARRELERALEDLRTHRTLQAAQPACEQSIALLIEAGGAGQVIVPDPKVQHPLGELDKLGCVFRSNGCFYTFRPADYPEHPQMRALLEHAAQHAAESDPAAFEALLARIEARAREALATGR